jgi:ABC-type glycerol-3-phosphate transport system permease component
METKAKKLRFKPSVSLIVLGSILVLYTVALAIPTIWAIITAVKQPSAFKDAVEGEQLVKLFGLNDLTLGNFWVAFTKFTIPVGTTKGPGLLHYLSYPILQMLGVDFLGSNYNVHLVVQTVNSLMYAGGCAFVGTIVPCIMAYLVARYDFALGKVVYAIVLATMAIPVVGNLSSEIRMVENLGLMDSIIGLYILKSNFLGIYFLVFYAQFKMIPKDYTEAAGMDGASEMRVMLQVILPIAFGTISTVFVLNFIAFWNDYQIPMIYWESRPVVAYGMYYVITATNVGMDDVPRKIAAMVMVAVPIIIIFLIFNKKIMANMSIGGVKG